MRQLSAKEPPTFIIASIGRTGSTTMATKIAKAVSDNQRFLREIDPAGSDEYPRVLKTHMRFREEFRFPYKAIFLYSDISSSIASLYLKAREGDLHFLVAHLENLGVRKRYIAVFAVLLRLKMLSLAFLFLIIKDKFHFMELIDSWKRAKNVLFVSFESLTQETDTTLTQIASFLEIEPLSLNVRERNSSPTQLPAVLRWAIQAQYSESGLQ